MLWVMASSSPQFATRDPRTAQFWDERFEKNFLPWDEGKSPQPLIDWLEATQPARGARVLIPGAGSAYEVQTFHACGCDVLAIDISAAAVAKAREVLGPLASKVMQADAFTFAPSQPFDLVYERAFLCALPADMHSQWSEAVHRWLAPGGLLAGFFYLREPANPEAASKGPPFAVAPEALKGCLRGFDLQADAPHDTRLKAFGGGVRWQVWRRS
ncbi:MAG: methyltransferase domain-containing protein [Burkholderiaceae bacterium]